MLMQICTFWIRQRSCWDWDLINDLNSNGLCTQLGNSSNVASSRYMRRFKESPVIAIVNKGSDRVDYGRELWKIYPPLYFYIFLAQLFCFSRLGNSSTYNEIMWWVNVKGMRETTLGMLHNSQMSSFLPEGKQGENRYIEPEGIHSDDVFPFLKRIWAGTRVRFR